MRAQHKTFLIPLTAGIWFLALFSGCASVQEKPSPGPGTMDNPGHHYRVGMEFLEKRNLDRALEEFERAKTLDPKYGPAYAGLGLVLSETGDYKRAEEFLSFASQKASNKEQRVIAESAFIRHLSLSQPPNWVFKVQERFNRTDRLSPDSSLLHYTMGKAMERAWRYDQAEGHFKKVLDLNREYVRAADTELKRVQIIKRAAPGTRAGHQIALLDQMDRANVAALFSEELQLDRLLKASQEKKEGFKTPQEYTAKKTGQDPSTGVPEDVVPHPLKADIEKVLSLGIRGLEVFPEGRFKPTEPISRSNFAIMIEDILLKASADPKLASKYLDNKSPYLDVPEGHYAFNAIMVCTMQGLIDPIDKKHFGLDESVSGAEALLVVRKLKNELKRFE